jgi:hypothetical protein
MQPTGAVALSAQTDTVFVLGSGVQHPHDLFVGPYSVRTNEEALRHGQAGIRESARLLRLQRRL